MVSISTRAWVGSSVFWKMRGSGICVIGGSKSGSPGSAKCVTYSAMPFIGCLWVFGGMGNAKTSGGRGANICSIWGGSPDLLLKIRSFCDCMAARMVAGAMLRVLVSQYLNTDRTLSTPASAWLLDPPVMRQILTIDVCPAAVMGEARNDQWWTLRLHCVIPLPCTCCRGATVRITMRQRCVNVYTIVVHNSSMPPIAACTCSSQPANAACAGNGGPPPYPHCTP